MAINTEIPTFAGRPFSERVTLPVPYGATTTFTLQFYWNKRAQCWVVDFLDSTAQYKILCGVPLVTGADLLEQFLYLDLGRNAFLTVMTIGPGLSPDTVPTFNNLGIDGHLYLTTPP
jgi:hypothetical protein